MEEERYLITAVQKALKILTLILQNENGLSFSQITKLSGGMNKSNVLRILYTLKSEGYVDFDEASSLYKRGAVFASLSAGDSFASLRLMLEDELRKAADQTGMIVHFTVAAADRLRLLLRIFPSASFEPLALANMEENEVPLNATGAGKIFAAFADEELKARLIAACSFSSYSENTITDRQEFMRIAAEARRNGFASNNCEHEEFLCCFTRPVFAKGGKLAGALSFSGLKDMFRGERYEKMKAYSLVLTEDLSRRLGYEE